MKLFDTFEAVKFPQENLIIITDDGFLYYSKSSNAFTVPIFSYLGEKRLSILFRLIPSHT